MKNFNAATLVLPLSILIGGMMVTVTPGSAKKEYTAKEKKACVYCHVKTGEKELNEAGKYYQEHGHSLDGYKPPAK